jgi:hypothetical protein
MKYNIWAYCDQGKQYYFETTDRESFAALYRYFRRKSLYGMIQLVSVHECLEMNFPEMLYSYEKKQV